MTTKEQTEKKNDIELHRSEALADLIREQVIHALGQPANLINVQVHSLWENRFRVNVLVGLDIFSGRVANSFFLTADSDGIIVTSIPQITKKYRTRGEKDRIESNPSAQPHKD